MTKHTSYSAYTLYWDRTWEVQIPPFHRPLPFSFAKGYRTSYADDFPGSQNFGPEKGHGFDAQLLNRCYDKFTSQLLNQSQWANNLIEARESIEMISSKAHALIGAIKAVRNKDVRGVLSSLGYVQDASVAYRPKTKGRKGGGTVAINVNKVRRIVRGSKSFGNKWLELHFGWVPLVDDIGAAVETLQVPSFGSKRVRSSTHCDVQTIQDNLTSQGGEYQRFDVSYTLTQRADVSISNPNALYANQLGFVNPLSVLWEAIPYSFVVDWFANVGQVLSAMTDFVGLDLNFPAYTLFQSGSYTHLNFWTGSSQIPAYNFSTTGNSVYCDRTLGTIAPVLRLKPFKGFSVERGATAISLLLQHLRHD